MGNRNKWIWFNYVGRGLMTLISGGPRTHPLVFWDFLFRIGQRWAKTLPRPIYPAKIMLVSNTRHRVRIDDLPEYWEYEHTQQPDLCPYTAPLPSDIKAWAERGAIFAEYQRRNQHRYDLVVFELPGQEFWVPRPDDEAAAVAGMLNQYKGTGAGVLILNFSREETSPPPTVSKHVLASCDIVIEHVTNDLPYEPPPALTEAKVSLLRRTKSPDGDPDEQIVFWSQRRDFEGPEPDPTYRLN